MIAVISDRCGDGMKRKCVEMEQYWNVLASGEDTFEL